MTHSNYQDTTYIDNNGQVHRGVPGTQAPRSSGSYRSGRGEGSGRMLTIAMIAMLLMGLASLGGGKSEEQENALDKDTTAERILVSEQHEGMIAGSKAVISGELERYPDSPWPYKIRYADRDIPIELRNGDQYLGSWVNLWIQYTGDGDKFVIKRVNVIE
jgi:hypothetical protein